MVTHQTVHDGHVDYSYDRVHLEWVGRCSCSCGWSHPDENVSQAYARLVGHLVDVGSISRHAANAFAAPVHSTSGLKIPVPAARGAHKYAARNWEKGLFYGRLHSAARTPKWPTRALGGAE